MALYLLEKYKKTFIEQIQCDDVTHKVLFLMILLLKKYCLLLDGDHVKMLFSFRFHCENKQSHGTRRVKFGMS